MCLSGQCTNGVKGLGTHFWFGPQFVLRAGGIVCIPESRLVRMELVVHSPNLLSFFNVIGECLWFLASLSYTKLLLNLFEPMSYSYS